MFVAGIVVGIAGTVITILLADLISRVAECYVAPDREPRP